MLNRVFVLGAGFSKAAGLPLATELTDEVLRDIRERVGDEYGLIQFAGHIAELHGWLGRSGAMRALNIEEFYNYATVYEERLMMDQHRATVGRFAGETPFAQARDIRTWLQQMDKSLIRVVVEYEQSASPDAVSRFVGQLRPNDVVITFNYDRLLERCLALDGVSWFYGLSASRAQTTSILKMHGSIDWICLARDQNPAQHGLQRLFSKSDVNLERRGVALKRTGEPEYDYELYLVPSDDRLRNLVKKRGMIKFDHQWGLAGLGPLKRPSVVPGLGLVWEHARRALFDADLIVVVGFSFSGYDRLAQIEFARVMAGRDEHGKPPPSVIVIDPALRSATGRPSAQGTALIERIEAVFRPVMPVGMTHEEFDWCSLDKTP